LRATYVSTRTRTRQLPKQERRKISCAFTKKPRPSSSLSELAFRYVLIRNIIKKLNDLEMEIRELLAKAERADSTLLKDGLTIPSEVQRRVER
jgi:hypothetical protein